MAGLTDILIVGGVIAVPVIAYATDFAGFRTWLETAGAAGGGAPNRCWPVGDGRCACSCHGKQSVILGAARGCDDCSVICRTGQAPDPPLGKQKCAAAPSKSGSVIPNKCWEISPGGYKACSCHGQQYFQMGPSRKCPQDCDTACATRASAFARSFFTTASSFATYPMKGLTVA